MFDSLEAKNSTRLDRAMKEPSQSETGKYAAFYSDEPYGRRYEVKLSNGGSARGEFITPSAVGTGRQVTVYRDASGYLFDAL